MEELNCKCSERNPGWGGLKDEGLQGWGSKAQWPRKPVCFTPD